MVVAKPHGRRPTVGKRSNLRITNSSNSKAITLTIQDFLDNKVTHVLVWLAAWE